MSCCVIIVPSHAFFDLQWRWQVWKEREEPFHLTRKVFGKKLFLLGKFTEKNYLFIDQLVKYIPLIIWQGSLEVNPRVLIGSFLVGILPYGPFPWKQS